MLFQHLHRKLCYVIVLCMLFFEMSSANVEKHFSFVSPETISPVSANLTDALLLAQKGTTAKQAYTAESIAGYKLLISPRPEYRRTASRPGNRGFTWLVSLSCLGAFLATLFNTFLAHLYDEITPLLIIISYIHQQDGDKHRVSFA